MVLFLFFVVLVVVFFLSVFKIVNQAQVMIIERLVRFNRILHPGLQFIIPFVDTVRGVHWKKVLRMPSGESYSVYSTVDKIDLRESVFDFPRQNVITKDNVTISINALLYFQIIDPKSAVYEIENLPVAIEKLTQTTLRNVIGEQYLDTNFTSRDIINEKLQDIIPTKEIQNAMEKQMKAERDRRAAILEAEGLKKAAILEAEGVKESQINKAEGEKQAEILVAEGKAQARIREAEGEAQAIKNIIDALSGNGQPDKYLIAMKYIETLQEMTSGKDNKVVYMPYEATGILSSVDGIKQMFDKK